MSLIALLIAQTTCPPDVSAAEEYRRHVVAEAERDAKEKHQVGALIADGKCEEAKRLAKFYNKPDIIKDTARACP